MYQKAFVLIYLILTTINLNAQQKDEILLNDSTLTHPNTYTNKEIIKEEHSNFYKDTLRKGKIFQNRLEFKSCQFLGNTNISDRKFNLPLILIDNNLQQEFALNNDTFNSYLDLYNDTIRESLDIENCNFNDMLYIGSKSKDTTINGVREYVPIPQEEKVAIKFCQFDKSFGLSNIKFDNDFIFAGNDVKNWSIIHAQFDGRAYFDGANFLNGVNFGNSEFNSIVSFDDAKFHYYVDFYGAKINKTLDFSDLHLDSFVVSFSNAVLPELIVFVNNTSTKGKADFTLGLSGNTNQIHYINVFQSDISTFKIEYNHFRLCFFNRLFGDSEVEASLVNTSNNNAQDSIAVIINKNKKLYSLSDPELAKKLLTSAEFRTYISSIFPGTEPPDSIINDFISFNIYMYGILPSRLTTDEKTSIYEMVLKNFQENGQMDSYEKLDIEYKNFKNGIFILPRIWNNYGYDKELIFAWTIGFLIIFTTITYFNFDKLNKKAGDKGAYFIESLNSNGFKSVSS
jgi:pentapeptide repeat protein